MPDAGPWVGGPTHAGDAGAEDFMPDAGRWVVGHAGAGQVGMGRLWIHIIKK